MNCHIIPQVYLRSWKRHDTENGIYLFDKNNPNAKGIEHNIGNLKKTDFAIEDRYIVKIDNYIFDPREEYEFLYDRIKNYKIEYNNIQIDNIDKFILNFSEIDQWDIQRKNGSQFSPDDMKKMFLHMWEGKIAKTIEKYFGRNLENKWNDFLKYINEELVNKKSILVQAKKKEFLMEFLTIQFIRSYDNLKRLVLDSFLKALKPIEKLFEQGIDEEEFKNDLILYNLYNYSKEKNTGESQQNIIDTIININSEKFQTCFILAPRGVDFITSDNCCYYISKDLAELKNTAGIYMPINKKACVYLCLIDRGVKRNKYVIMDANRQIVKFINHLTLIKSKKMVGYFEDEIKDIIDARLSNESWYCMLNEASLKIIS